MLVSIDKEGFEGMFISDLKLLFLFLFPQERLLLSVLPEHVAAEIRDDLGSVVTGQFKKIYISRHENVRYVLLIE